MANIHAPFTPKQVERLNHYQFSSSNHPYTPVVASTGMNITPTGKVC